jgi:hypothetical protein
MVKTSSIPKSERHPMVKPLYKEQFPKFELDVQIPEGFTDASWCNDQCPSWEHEGLQLKLFIDFKDPAQREEATQVRFNLLDMDDFIDYVASNNWQDVLDGIEKVKQKKGAAA